MFNDTDLKQIHKKGADPNSLYKQIENFKRGFPFAQLDRAATCGDGILSLDENEVSELIDFYEKKSGNFSIIKFVPASGAASRMFQALFNFL
ncbi:MAG: DUF4301 family protein, partial [Bacteroidetes bacterium]|nr:DUF4301 family protein [Bacteroidota bacterium]